MATNHRFSASPNARNPIFTTMKVVTKGEGCHNCGKTSKKQSSESSYCESHSDRSSSRRKSHECPKEEKKNHQQACESNEDREYKIWKERAKKERETPLKCAAERKCDMSPSAILRMISPNVNETKVGFSENIQWSLTKVPTITFVRCDAAIDWTITVDRAVESSSLLRFEGDFMISNSGTVAATIGNFVSNLQRQSCRSKTWRSIAANVANSSKGVDAKSVDVAPDCDSEGVMHFRENCSSVSLSVSIEGKDLFSMSPLPTIMPGQTVTISYVSVFDASDLELKKGEEFRLETIMSFGNATDGCGNYSVDIDISGDDVISVDEHKVVSLANHFIFQLCSLAAASQSVILSDPITAIITTGGAKFTNYTSFGNYGSETISSDATFPIVRHVTVLASTDGPGLINDTATLASLPGDINVVHLTASSTVDVFSGTVVMNDNYCTSTQEEWGAPAQGVNAGTLLVANFATVYPQGMVVIGALSNFSASFSLLGVQNYLPASGDPGLLSATATDPMSTSAGSLGGEVLALQFNVGFSLAGITGMPGFSFPALVYTGPPGDSLSGSSVAAILARANAVIGGSASLPMGYTLAAFNALIHNLNAAYANCSASAWALLHLAAPAM